MANSPGTTVNVCVRPERSLTIRRELANFSTVPCVPVGRWVMGVPWTAPITG